jgi:calcium/calmodulin-dependent protein kinase I
LFSKISEGKFAFNDSEWKDVSKEAKSFVTDLLAVDFSKRPSIQQTSSHAWLKSTYVCLFVCLFVW